MTDITENTSALSLRKIPMARLKPMSRYEPVYARRPVFISERPHQTPHVLASRSIESKKYLALMMGGCRLDQVVKLLTAYYMRFLDVDYLSSLDCFNRVFSM